MSPVVGAQFKSVRAWLRKTDIRHRGIRTGNVHRGRSRIQFPENRRGPAWIDNCSGQRRTQCANRLIRAGIDCRGARRSWTLVGPGRLDYFEIADVDR